MEQGIILLQKIYILIFDGSRCGSHRCIAETNYLCGARRRAFSASRTLAVINSRKIVFHMDSVVLAFFLAKLAADTAAFANAADDFANLRGGTANVNFLVNVPKHNKLVGTHLCTKSAAYALCLVNTGKTVLDNDSVLRANLCAVPEAETAVSADLRAAVETVRRLAGLYSLKDKFAFRGVAVSAAKDYCNLGYNSHFFHAHDRGDFLSAFRAAGLAHICGYAVFYNGGSVVSAARKAAGSAVYLREYLVDRFNAFVGFDFKNF